MNMKNVGVGFMLASVLFLSACVTPPTGDASTTPPSKPIGPVTVNGSCEQRDDMGYSDKISIVVKDNVVSALDWTAKPRGNACRFLLKNFKQISSTPIANLQHKKDKKCHIFVWQDERHITVATNTCRKVCGQNDRLLPVLLDPSTGSCKAVPK